MDRSLPLIVRRVWEIAKWLFAFLLSAAAAGVISLILFVLLPQDIEKAGGISFSTVDAATIIFELMFYGVFMFGANIAVMSFIPTLLVSGLWEFSGHRPSYSLYSAAGASIGAILSTFTMWADYRTVIHFYGGTWSQFPADVWPQVVSLTAGGLLGGFTMAWIRTKQLGLRPL